MMKIDVIWLVTISLIGGLLILKTLMDGEKKKIYDDLREIGKSEINVSRAGLYISKMFIYEHVKWGSLFRVEYKSMDGKDFRGRCVVYYDMSSGLEIKWLD